MCHMKHKLVLILWHKWICKKVLKNDKRSVTLGGNRERAMKNGSLLGKIRRAGRYARVTVGTAYVENECTTHAADD